MFHIIGSGACGFLRLYYLLEDEIPINIKVEVRSIKIVFRLGMMMV